MSRRASVSASAVHAAFALVIVAATACSTARDEGSVHDARHAVQPAEQTTTGEDTAGGGEAVDPSGAPDTKVQEGAGRPAAPTDPSFGCDVDADCVRVDKGCCKLGDYIGVQKDKASAYEASLECAAVMCPMMMVLDDHSVAQCKQETRTCEIVKPTAIACNGFTRNSHACPDGWQCILPEHVADVPGRCLERCGGFANLQCSDGNASCMDDPTDSCNPNAGGADCGGLCFGTTP